MKTYQLTLSSAMYELDDGSGQYVLKSDYNALVAKHKASVKDAIIAMCAMDDRMNQRWDPMETAPKDGTTILVYGKRRADHGRVEVAAVAWGTNAQQWIYEDIWFDQPLGWQPLPKPPTTP